MGKENIPLIRSSADQGFYTGEESSSGEVGSTGISRRVLHGLTIISILIACGCSIYGALYGKNAMLLCPLIIVLLWLSIHVVLIVFARGEKHEFQPPGWFIFVSSGHIVIQSLVVIILTLFKE